MKGIFELKYLHRYQCFLHQSSECFKPYHNCDRVCLTLEKTLSPVALRGRSTAMNP